MATLSSTVPAWHFTQSIANNQQTTFGIDLFSYSPTNVVYQITMSLSATDYAGIAPGGSTTPSVTDSMDPLVMFAAGFDSTGYLIAFGPAADVEPPPVTSVPEPATTAMLIAGALAWLAVRNILSRRMPPPSRRARRASRTTVNGETFC